MLVFGGSTCHITSIWFSSREGAEFGHHPSSNSRRGTTGASVEHGVLGITVPWNHRNLRADPPPNANLWEPKASASGKKIASKRKFWQTTHDFLFQRKTKTVTLSKHLGHSPWTLGLKDPNWLNICPMGCFNYPTVSKTLSRFSLSYDVAPVRADTTFSIPLTLGMQASHLSTNSGAKS